MNPPSQTCPPVLALENYLKGSLGLGESETVEDHIEVCKGCEEKLQHLLSSQSFMLNAEPVGEFQPDLDVTAGRYENLERLGSGGFGTIWKMRDTKFNRVVAVKVMKPERASNPSLVRRFLAEAQICSQLSHPFIVPIYDMGFFNDGRAYVAMKLIEGNRLDEAFSPDASAMEKVNAFASLCQAVAHAHQRGVVHRDLKPQNVMVGAHGEIQLIDWGLAKAVGQPDIESEMPVSENVRLDRDQTQTALGTLAYMAPEQFKDAAAADQRSDVFSLGAILCELLTGKPPYQGDAKAVLAAVKSGELKETYQRLSNIEVDQRLAGIARDCLAVDPKQRPQNADTLSTRVQKLLRSFDEEAEHQRAALIKIETRQQESKKRARLRWSLAAVAVLASVIVGGTLWMRSVERQAREVQAIELTASANEEFAVGSYADALQQVSLAVEASPTMSGELEQLSNDIKLCQELDEVFQEQAASQAIRHMGIIVSTREQDAAKRRALAKYDELLADPELLGQRFEGSAGKEWLAAALSSRAWLVTQLRPEDRSTVIDCLDVAKELDTDSDINSFLYDESNWDDPKAVAEKLKTDSDGEVSQGALNLATEVLIRGNIDPAVIRDVVARSRDNFGVNLRWSSKLAYRDSDTGLQFAQVAASLRPQSLIARLNLATLFWVNGDHTGALRECQRVLKQDSNNVRAQILFADLLKDSDNDQKTIEAYERAIELGTEDEDVIPLVKLGNLLRRDDKSSEKALEKFNQALTIDPESAFALYHKGQHLDESGNPEEAIELYEKALENRPDYSFVHNNLGKSLIMLYIKHRNEDLSEAIKFRQKAQSHFLTATQLDPDNVWAHANLGNTYNDEGKVDDAIACFRKALKLDPKHHGAGFNLANTLLNDQKFVESIEAANTFLEHYPESDIGWFVRGIAEAELDRSDYALNSLQRSIKFAEAKGRSAKGQKEMLAELRSEIGVEDQFASAVATALAETSDPVIAAGLLQGKGLSRTSFLTLREAMKNDDKFKTPRLTMRAARFGVAAAIGAPSDELAHQYLLEAAESFSDCLGLVEEGFEDDFTAEEFLVNVEMTIIDAVKRESLDALPEKIKKAWLDVHDRLDKFQALDLSKK